MQPWRPPNCLLLLYAIHFTNPICLGRRSLKVKMLKSYTTWMALDWPWILDFRTSLQLTAWFTQLVATTLGHIASISIKPRLLEYCNLTIRMIGNLLPLGPQVHLRPLHDTTKFPCYGGYGEEVWGGVLQLSACRSGAGILWWSPIREKLGSLMNLRATFLSCPKRIPILSSERGFLPTFLCTCDSNRDSGFYFKTFSIGIKRLASPHHILDLHIIQMFNIFNILHDFQYFWWKIQGNKRQLKEKSCYNCPLFPVDLSSKTSSSGRLHSWGWRHENLMHLFFRAF